MGLERYRRRRDFRATPEPRGEASSSDGGSFVVQRHQARRLHFDFRLELGGVLKSWAVPKGPSLDPRERRLAVEVEDHPVAYGGFEGEIPRGHYGAGQVVLWDRGRWTPESDAAEQLRRGKLTFRLEGLKLRGRWALVRLRAAEDEAKPNWLLMKLQDEEARSRSEGEIVELRPESVWSAPSPAAVRRRKADRAAPMRGARRAPMPAWVEPQMATLVDETPSGDAWIHEMKLDGYRMLCRINAGDARFLTRKEQDWTDRYGPLAEACRALPVRQALLDGEVVALDERGVPDFQLLQNALRSERHENLIFYAFDILYVDGYDVSAAPLLERKRLLRALLASAPPQVRYMEHVVGEGPQFYRRACDLELEGVVSKRRDGAYRPGRGRDWLKVKCRLRQEFVVGGFTEPAGARTNFGALLLGYYDEAGRLVYAGRTGTGFTKASLAELHEKLRTVRRATRPFGVFPQEARLRRGVHWVEPCLVAEVAFAGWTRDGIVRQATFQGVREDKPAREVRRDQSRPLAAVEVAGVPLSNPDRIVCPDAGITKRDLARYYEQVADWILPHVVRRPLSIVRCPEGRSGECFYQKRVGPGAPSGVRRVRVRTKRGSTDDYICVEDLAGLIGLVQLGAIEIHPWGARVDRLEQPDRMVLDIDPSEGVAWPDVVTTARFLHERLDGLGLKNYLRTTGGAGLHVVVPLSGEQGWEEVRDFAHRMAAELVRLAPDRYTDRVSREGRKGKILIDYLRNSRGATAVASYSARALAGAPVATPLRWEELGSLSGSASHTISSVPRRLSRLGEDPWKGFFEARQSLSAAMRRAVA